ncbi:MAG: hypothetical protein IPN94_25440 [Sphingobacteriales bacterium]|nr:hypothetical protein [Sphingobacteriales bacterium]
MIRPIAAFILNFQEGQGNSINSQMSKEKQLLFIRNYVPFQWRQLIQVWRSLENNKGKAKDTDEIDINASLKNYTKRAFGTTHLSHLQAKPNCFNYAY